jgi:exopolyphosphatase/guanosine-5'-triphosphate,3'-diphosphate pyrophosphatase
VRIAALDLGSNSFHLVVAEVQPGGFEPIVTEKEMLRLGEVVARHGHIPAAAADAAVASVRRFRQLAEAAGAVEVVACATSALRRAANGGEVVDRIEAEAQVAVEVISGLREAELIFRAIRAGVLLEPAPALGFDLGGGSVEITVGDAAGLRFAASENLGVGTLTAAFVTGDPLDRDDEQRLRTHLGDVLGPVAEAVAPFAPRLVVGSSGTLPDVGRPGEADPAPLAEPVHLHARRLRAGARRRARIDRGRASAPRRSRRPARRSHRRRGAVPRRRDGALRLRRDDDQRMGPA